MQVLLWGLPLWMHDVVERAVCNDVRLGLVSAPADASDLYDAVERTRPDVVLTNRGDCEASFRGFAPLLFKFPLLRVYAIGCGDAGTVEVTLLPAEESLGDVSLDALVSLIGDRGTESLRLVLSTRRQ